MEAVYNFKSVVLFKYALGNDIDAELKLIIEEICDLQFAKI